MARTVGIDLGTTYSLIAYQDKQDGKPKCVPGPYGTPLCPSVVSVDADGSIVVGEAARRRLLTQPGRTIYSVKRLMGRGPADVQDELKIFPFRIDSASKNVIRVRLGERVFTPPEISAFILRELKCGPRNIFRIRSRAPSLPCLRISTTRKDRPRATPVALPASKSCAS